MNLKTFRVIWVLLGVVSGVSLASGQSEIDSTGTHPLDPLTGEEYRRAVSILKDAGLVTESGLYHLITLEEPGKDVVINWKPGESAARKALVLARSGSTTIEAVVDLRRLEVATWREVEDAEPNLLLSEEWSKALRTAWAHKPWREAFQNRGITNLQEVVCTPHTVGYFGGDEARRLIRLVCYDGSESDNYWGRPIEGLQAEIDLNTAEVVRLIDTGSIPVPDAPVDFDENSVTSTRGRLNPIEMVQIDGPSFLLDGRVVRWQNWQFHFRVDPRVGVIISLVRYNDSGKPRSIMYQGSLSEVFVPYMDPSDGWFFRTYLDAGEFGIGKLTSELVAGADCPSNAVFFDAEFADDWGEPYTVERAVCLFERSAGNVAWRHFEVETGRTETRKQTDLVVRSIAAIGNYDYVLDWVFQQNGSIKVVVGATGVEQVKAVWSSSKTEDEDGRETEFGRLVAPRTVAVNHDHFFSFRLDMDVDGPSNSFQRDALVPRTVDDSPRKSVWVVKSDVADTENQAMQRLSLEHPALWRVTNAKKIGPLGYPPSYQIRPSFNALPLLTPDDLPQSRAGFTRNNLWVTAFDPDEKYAAGKYPNQSRGDDGLPKWTAGNRSIVDTDIVVWYTLGFHHVVRAEDWPVLPTSWHEFEIRPFDFFSRNPSLDLPAE